MSFIRNGVILASPKKKPSNIDTKDNISGMKPNISLDKRRAMLPDTLSKANSYLESYNLTQIQLGNERLLEYENQFLKKDIDFIPANKCGESNGVPTKEFNNTSILALAKLPNNCKDYLKFNHFGKYNKNYATMIYNSTRDFIA